MKIKQQLTLILSTLCLLAVIAGCSMFGNNPAPPTAFEQKLFDVTTNFVTRVQTNTVTQTNFVIVPVTQTNIVLQTVQVTNTTGIVIPQMNTTFTYQTVFQTNTVITTNAVTVTNTLPSYNYTPNQAAQTGAGIAGTLANAGMPGIGSLVSMGIIGALGIYGKLRGNKVAGALSLGIETARNVIQTTPNGQQLDAAYKAWLVSHQSAAGVIDAVTSIVNKQVNTPTGEAIAQAGANQITASANPPPAAAKPTA